MRGWRALTSDWDRPIRPAPPVARAAPARLTVIRRPRLVPSEVRKVLFDLDEISQKAQAEIRRLFAERGLDSAQQSQQMSRIRRERG